MVTLRLISVLSILALLAVGTGVAAPLPQAEPTPIHAPDRSAPQADWDNWQASMRAAYDQAVSFTGSAEQTRHVWDQFLLNYPQKNPYSNEDVQMRAYAEKAINTLEIGPNDQPRHGRSVVPGQ